MFKTSFPALTGILTLAYFIHNCILSIMRNQENPKNNVSASSKILKGVVYCCPNMNQSVLVPLKSHYAMCMGNPATLVY